MSLGHAKLEELRKTHLWACLSHFLTTFKAAINLPQCTVVDVEEDLSASATTTVPKLIHRLLYILTHDRKINAENFETYLRRQFAKRHPFLQNPLGSEEEPIPWTDLGMLVKLKLIFHLCEWQFTGPARLRTMMDDEQEQTDWRLEPIGQDAKRNTYWFIGPDRLWVQRSNPNPPEPRKTRSRRGTKGIRVSNSKPSVSASRPAVTTAKSKSNAARGKVVVVPKSEPKKAPIGRRRGRPRKDASVTIVAPLTPPPKAAPGTRSRPTRAAAAAALSNILPNILPNGRTTRRSKRPVPVDSDTEDQAGVSTESNSGSGPSPNKRSRTTRRSARQDLEDEWQVVPEEWLRPAGNSSKDEPAAIDEEQNRNSVKEEDGAQVTSSSSTPAATPALKKEIRNAEDLVAAVFGDDDSELTDLSDEDDNDGSVKQEDGGNSDDDEHEEDDNDDDEEGESDTDEDEAGVVDEETAIREAATRPPDWLEWETVCATVEEWETFPQQFEGSNSTKERALYKTLMRISATVCEELRFHAQEAARQLQLSLAVHTRKRSTRLLVIEQDRAAIEAEKQKRQEIEEAHSREIRQMKREQIRAQREMEREKRAKEREERLKPKEVEAVDANGKARSAQAEDVNAQVDVEGGDTHSLNGNGKRAASTSGSTSRPRRTRAPRKSEDWELDCEICFKRGVNIDDGREITCCEKCGRWQHVDCHNQADAQAGRPPRDWNTVDFMCYNCDRNPKKPTRARAPKTAGSSGVTSTSRSKARGQPTVPSMQPAPPPSGYPMHWATREGYNAHIPNSGVPPGYGRPPLPAHFQQYPQRGYQYPGAAPGALPSYFPSPTAAPPHYTHPQRPAYPIPSHPPPQHPNAVLGSGVTDGAPSTSGYSSYGMPSQYFPVSYPPAHGQQPPSGVPPSAMFSGVPSAASTSSFTSHVAQAGAQPSHVTVPSAQQHNSQPQYRRQAWAPSSGSSPTTAPSMPVAASYSNGQPGSSGHSYPNGQIQQHQPYPTTPVGGHTAYPQYQQPTSHQHPHYQHQPPVPSVPNGTSDRASLSSPTPPMSQKFPNSGQSAGSWGNGAKATAAHTNGYVYENGNGNTMPNIMPNGIAQHGPSSAQPQPPSGGGYPAPISLHVRPVSGASTHSSSQSPGPLSMPPQPQHGRPPSAASMPQGPTNASTNGLHTLAQQAQVLLHAQIASNPTSGSSGHSSYI